MPQLDVTIVGDSNLDVLLYGLPEELTLEREWIADRMAMTLGGSAAITAHNLAALGSRVGLITPMAGDAFEGVCTQALADAGVDLSRAVRMDGEIHTGVSVLLQHEHSRRMLTYPGATGALRFSDIDLDYLGSSRHFHLSSYFLQAALQPDAGRLLAWCKEAGLTTSLDTNDDPSGKWDESILELLRHVNIFMPNEREACQITREPDLEAAIRKLTAQVPLLVMKRGRQGALACRGSERWEARGIDIDIVDAVGAGDSFNAGFLHGFLHEWPVEKCLEFGNLAGAYSTTALGGIEAFRSREQWQAFVAQHTALAASPRQ
jgi:sugar/nucleoside kinase (ribokinase family)